MPKKGRASLQDRIHRIQGQLSGVEKMIESEEDIENIMIQVQAVISGLESFRREIIRKQISSAVTKQVEDALEMLK